MAKSSKLEDYWRQHNIENLFKDLTHALVQRMPSDPALALVQHLQKKYPRSFKSSADDDNRMGTMSRTAASTLQLPLPNSSRLDLSFSNTNDLEMQRRDSNQSLANSSIVLPTTGSAFTDLLKQNTDSTKQAPGLNMKNLMFVSRLGQQAVKLGKDLRSDHDILDEEIIKPAKIYANGPPTAHTSILSPGENMQQLHAHEQPAKLQLIKYKQTIRTENDRRLHREELARVAKKEYDKQTLHPNIMTPTENISLQNQQQKLSEDQTVSQANKDKVGTKPIRKAVVKSKEEEELLNAENLFDSKISRNRDRNRNKVLPADLNTSYSYKQTATNLGASMRTTNNSSMPMMRFGICKKCGNIMNDELNQSASAEPVARPFDSHPSPHSAESNAGVVDDWFESASEVSSSREIVPWAPDSITPQPTEKNTLQRNFFQPIHNDVGSAQNRVPAGPIIVADNQTTSNRSTSRMSESDVFERTSSPTFRRPPISPSRNITSPIAKRNQGDTLAVPGNQSSKPIGPPASTSTPISMFADAPRQITDWGAFE